MWKRRSKDQHNGMTVTGFILTPEPTKNVLNRGNHGFYNSGNQGRIMALKERKQKQNPSNCAVSLYRIRSWMSPSVRRGNQVNFARLLSWEDSWKSRHIKEDSLQSCTLFPDDCTVRIHSCVWENYQCLSKRATRGLEGTMFDTHRDLKRAPRLSSSGSLTPWAVRRLLRKVLTLVE